MKKINLYLILSILCLSGIGGLKAQTYTMGNGTINTCSGTFYDPGGTGNYTNSQSFTQTFCSNNGLPIYLQFTAFQTESSFDIVTIYNGATTASPVLGTYSGTTSPGTITASGTCITISFTSDGSVVYSGWSATIGCGSPPPPPPPPPGAGCSNPNPFCGTQIQYPAGTNNGTAPSGPAYGCLGSQPNPAWFNMQVANSGPMNFSLSAGADIDYIIWGPFTTPTGACLAGLTSANIVSCSYSASANEFPSIPNAVTGQWYILLITNFSNQPVTITFNQTGGSGTANCNILCNITGMTGTPGACQPATNTFNVTGTLTTTSPPNAGTLTISSSCGGTPLVFNPPFSTSMNYTLTGLPTGTGTCTLTASYSADPTCTRTVTVTAPPTCTSCNATASNTGPYCAGSTINLSSTGTVSPAGPITYTWAGPNGFTATGQNVSIPSSTTSHSGTYTVTVTSGTITCTGTTSVTVNPNPTITVSSATVCAGGTATLTASGASSYSWGTSATPVNPSTGSTVTVTPPSTETFTVTGTSASNCVSIQTATVVVNSNPVVDAGSNTAICSGNTTVLNATGANSYQWSADPGISNLNIPNPVASPVSTVTYTVTGTDLNGCYASDTVVITVNPNPVVVVAPATICYGNTATLTASGAVNYNWQTANTPLNPSTGPTVSVTPQATETFTVTGIDANGCVGTQTVTVTVNMNPPVDAGFNDTVCSGSSTQLAAIGALNYQWNASTDLSNTSISNPFATPSTTTTYTVTGTDANGCFSTDSVTVLVAPVFSLTTNSIDATCYGSCNGVASVSANPSSGPFANYTYLWSNGSTAPIISNLCAGTYSVEVRDISTCLQTATVTINQPTAVVLSQAYVTPATCNSYSDGTAAVNTTGGTPGYIYSWSPSGGTLSSATGLAAGNYVVTATDVNSCSTSYTITITQPQPIVITPPSNPTICYSQSATLAASATGGNGGYNFIWTDGTNQYTGASVTLNPTTTTNYSITVTDGLGCLGTNQPSAITVNVNPPLTINTINNTAICESKFIMMDVSGNGGNGNHIYTWTPMTGVTVLNGNSSSVKLSPSVTTAYTVTITDNCGTTPANTSFTLTVNPTPVLTITPPVSSGCAPLTVSFEGTSNPASANCSWSFGNDGTSANCNSVSHSFIQDGSYTITYHVTDVNGCENTKTSSVVVYPVPQAAFSASPQPTTIIDPVVTFTDITFGNIVNHTWIFNDSLGTTSTLATPGYTYLTPGVYPVTLAVETDKGCVDTVTQNVYISDYYAIYIPNAITPDGDGINEVFIPQGTGLTGIEMTIFDRWGGKVFATNKLDEGWNGRDKSNNKVEKGVYIYNIIATNFLGEKKQYTGHVTVVR